MRTPLIASVFLLTCATPALADSPQSINNITLYIDAAHQQPPAPLAPGLFTPLLKLLPGGR